MFVTWSAHQVGIPLNVILRYALVLNGMNWYKEKGSEFFKTYEETQRGLYLFI